MTAWAKALAVVRRRSVWIPGAVAGVVVLSYLAAFLYVGGGVPRGTTVRGVDIGGMTPVSAEQELKDELGPAASKPIRVKVGDKTFSIKPKAADLVFDAKASVDAAGQRSGNPLRLGGQLGGQTVEPVVRYDEAKLDRAVAKIAKDFDRPVREGKVSYEGIDPVATMPRAGRVIDRAGAVDEITAAYPSKDPVTLPVKDEEPKTRPGAVREIAGEAARTAVAAPVRLTTGKNGDKTTLAVSRHDLAAHTEFVAGGKGTLEPKVHGAGLAKDLGHSLARLETEPVDATFELAGGKPKVVPSKPGEMVDRKELGDAIVGVLDKTDNRSVAAPVRKAKPKTSTSDAKKLGIDRKVGSFTTHHPCCEPRVTNIHRAAEILDGTLVKPGKTFSLNGTLGQRTTDKGFVPAPMILDGRHVDSVGGGVSQIATTTFNAMFFAGLKDVQHQPHSYYISRYPLGREATISWTQPDLRFQNDTETGILITTSYTSTSITVNMWGTKHYDIDATEPQKSNYRKPKTIRDDSPDCTPEYPSQGYDVTYSRVFKRNGQVIRTEPFRTVYLAAPRVICETDDDNKKKDDDKKKRD
ncbi:MAG: hypothetical protein GEV07_05990 [Streptosporangiales bacterium]|nr:hypothetical protein [Streptosporangiales bacterium]